MLDQKIFVLDYELISPIAVGVENVMKNINSNYSAENTISRFPVTGMPFTTAAEIKEDLSSWYASEPDLIKDACKHDRKLELLAACFGKSQHRLAHLIKLMKPESTGVILGVGADVPQTELYQNKMEQYLSNNQNPLLEIPTELNRNDSKINLNGNAYDFYSIYLANKFNAGAFQKSILTACVSSTQAISFAYDAILSNDVDVVIAGGTDSIVNMLAMISFGKLGVIPEAKEGTSCSPFDANRNGALAGESAGFTILASEDFVKKNNIKPVAQILGYGNTLDGYKITVPDPSGRSMSQAIKDAISNAGITAKMVDYINAHGTGTRQNDELELKCFEAALGKYGKTIPISSTKDRHGHAIAAAGIQEFCILMELMKNDTIPKNRNLKTPCVSGFNLVTENTTKKLNYVLSSNFAFGGINTVLAIKNENL